MSEGQTESSPLRELIHAIAVELVDHPEEVDVVEIPGEHNSIIELRVAKDDIGKVIGKEGRTAQSMRTILTAVSQKLGRRVHLDIVD
jgi:predicted RNA-binding protein YlqC (UPF0109 family)